MQIEPKCCSERFPSLVVAIPDQQTDVNVGTVIRYWPNRDILHAGGGRFFGAGVMAVHIRRNRVKLLGVNEGSTRVPIPERDRGGGITR